MVVALELVHALANKLGCDASVVELAQAIGSSPDFSLAIGYELPSEGSLSTDALTKLLPRVSAENDDWESLLTPSIADLVIVGSVADPSLSGDRREEMLRRLVQAAIPLVVVHPVCDMLLAYELDMIRRDTQCQLFPYVPWSYHPFVREVTYALVHRPATVVAGDIEQFLWERHVTKDSGAKVDGLAHLARDTILLRKLLGEVTSVSATGGAKAASQYSNLSVHLTGPAGSSRFARWTIGPDDREGAKLTVLGAGRSVPLALSADGQTCIYQGGTKTASEQTAEIFLKEVAGSLGDEKAWGGIQWEDVCGTLEVTDAVKRSFVRRRTIELYHEQLTEYDTFKSLMAVGGCGMLLWVLTLLLIGGVVEGLELSIRETAIWSLWPVALLAPLAVFLALQLLQLLFERRDSSRG